MTYIADAYRAQTACALSANTIVRSAFGFGFPLVRVPLTCPFNHD